MGVGKVIGIIIILAILIGLYYLYENGTINTLLPSVFSTPISKIITNQQSYIGKQVTIYGRLEYGEISGNNWYALYGKNSFIEIHLMYSNPNSYYIIDENYTVKGIVMETKGCSLPYGIGVDLGNCNILTSGTPTTIYYVNASSIQAS